jgi:hypothetical protein
MQQRNLMGTQDEDFLLQRKRTMPIQFVGALVGALMFVAFAVIVWFLFVSDSLGSSDFHDIVILVIGSAVCILFSYLGWLCVKRAFRGRIRR